MRSCIRSAHGTTALAALALCALGCEAPPRAWAGKITSPSQLVGGPRTLGEVGDYRLSNGRVRFVVQSLDLAKDVAGRGIAGDRAFGAFGGALLDADLARPEEERDPRTQGNGRDGLGEIFPTFFLRGLEPDQIRVLDDGSTGAAAHLRVTGHGSDFFTATKLVNAAALGSGLDYLVDYRLGPSDDYLTLTASIVNPTAAAHPFPTTQFPIPIGFIGLFGDGQPLFMPGEAGYDVRFTLQRSYHRPYLLPALGGVTSDIVAVEGNGISYGLTYCATCSPPADLNAVASAPSFVWNHKDQYGKYAPVSEQSLLLPFVSGSLFGLYLEEVPVAPAYKEGLPGGQAVSATMKLRVAGPSLSKVIDAAYAEAGLETGTVSAVVREAETGLPLANVDVVLLAQSAPGVVDAVVDTKGSAVSVARSDEQGRITATLPPGEYIAVARLGRRDHAPLLPFHVALRKDTELEVAAQAAGITWRVPRTATLIVEVTDAAGRPIPAKVSVDAAYDEKYSGQDPKSFLYDLRLGDSYRPTDLTPDTSDPETRRFLEDTFRTVNGRAEGQVRPGKWRVTVSRGPAWSLARREVTLTAGEPTRLGVTLTRLLPARGRIAGDQHVHTVGSVDGSPSFEERVLSAAAEGIDWFVTTDHNALSDLEPAVDRTGLTDFLRTSVGIELSSLEAGHTNGYPLQWLPGPATHGSMPWFNRKPQDLFDSLRARRGVAAGDFVVQVNHPRDSVQGLFTAYGLTGDALIGDPAHDWPGAAGTFAPSGDGFGPGKLSLDFDAMEVLNSKRLDIVRTFRVPPPSQLPPPDQLPPPCTDVPKPKPPCLGATGSIVRDANGLVAFPGAFEDWEHLLDFGKKFTVLGNSDSHELIDGELGYPRNSIDLGHDPPSARAIDPAEVGRAIKAGRVVVTNGPELRLTLLDPTATGPDGKRLEVPIGGLVRPDASGIITAHLIVEAAPWIDVTRAALLVGRGGAPCAEEAGDCREVVVPIDRNPSGACDPDAGLAPGVCRLDTTVAIALTSGKRDVWVAAYVRGDTSLWPVVIPLEVPPLLLNDAIGALTAAFGLSDPLKKLRPVTTTQTLPIAISNPVFVDGDGDGKWFGKDVPAWVPASP